MRRGLLCGVFALFFLLDAAAQSLSVRVAPYRGNKRCAVSYTFDDGLRDQYTVAAPMLEKLGWRGTFAINGRKIDVAMAKGDTSRFFWPEVVELLRRGHEISNHGWEHKKMTRLTPERIQQEIMRNDSAILHHTGTFPLSFCYPYNAKDSLIRQMAEAGRVVSRMYQIAVGRASSAQKMQRWIDRTIAEGGWGVGMTHGILRGYDAFNTLRDFEDHLRYTHSKEDQIWVAPLAEVGAYLAEREHIRFEMEERRREVILTPGLDLDPKCYNQPLTLILGGVERVRQVRQGDRRLEIKVSDNHFLVDINPHGGPIRIRF